MSILAHSNHMQPKMVYGCEVDRRRFLSGVAFGGPARLCSEMAAKPVCSLGDNGLRGAADQSNLRPLRVYISATGAFSITTVTP